MPRTITAEGFSAARRMPFLAAQACTASQPGAETPRRAIAGGWIRASSDTFARVTTPEDALQAANERDGVHPGYRALHAKGTLFKGTFTPTPAAARLSR